MPRSRLPRSSLILVLVAWACVPDVPVSNPYDPALPPEQQQKATLDGLVRGESGPLTGATVTLQGPTTPATSPFATGDDGRFAFDDLIPGTYTLSVEHAQHLGSARDLILGPGEARAVELTLLARPSGLGADTGQLFGVAHLGAELPLPEAQQDHSGIVVEISAQGVRVTTNAAGRFDLFLAPGTYDLTLAASDHVTQALNGVSVVANQATEVGGAPIVLQANPGSISGRALREGAAAGEHALTQVEVIEAGVEGTTLGDGSFSILDVVPGNYTLAYSFDEFVAVILTGVVVRGGRDTALPAVTLARARGAITGVFTLEDETSFDGIAVTVGDTGSTALTDVNGAFLVTGVPVGTYALRASKPGFVDLEVSTVNVTEGAVTTLIAAQLAADPGTVSGTVRREQDTTHAGIALSLVGARSYAVVSAADGTYTFPAVRAGIYALTASDGGYADATLFGVLVDAGGVLVLPDLLLTLPRGHLQGQVQLSDGNSALLDNVVVRLKDQAGGTVASTVPEPTGAYRFNDVPVGTYDLVAELEDYTTARLDDVEVIAETTQNLTTLTLAPKTGDFTIDQAPYTNSLAVTLQLDNAAASGMRLSEDATFAAGADPFVTYISAPGFTLGGGDGLKTIYVQYCEDAAFSADCAGGLTTAVFSASITLDQTPPTLSAMTLDDGAAYTNTLTGLVVVRLTAADTGSGLRDVKLSNDTTFNEAAQDFAVQLEHTLGNLTVEESKTVYAVVRDQAGNTSAAGNAYSGVIVDAASAAIILDRTAPLLTGVTIDCNGVTSASHCASPLVTVSLTPVNPESTTVMALSNNGSFTAATFLPFAAESAWLLLPGDGTKTVSVMLRDAAGNATSGTDSDSVVLDGEPPSLTLALSGAGLGGASSTLVRSGTVTATLVASDNETSSVNLQMQVSNYANFTSDGTTPLAWAGFAGTIAGHPLLANTVSGTKRVYARVRDQAGNVTTTDASITLDVDPPLLTRLAVLEAVAGTNEPVVGATAITLQIDATGAAQLVISGDVTDGGTKSAAGSVGLTLSAAPGLKTITVAALDGAGNASLPATLPTVVRLDTAGPTGASLSINNGAGYATARAVTLTVSGATDAGGLAELAVVNAVAPSCAALSYTAYQPVLAWTLEATPGEQTVTVCLRDVVGNTTQVDDEIVYDPEAPTISTATLAGGATYTASPTVAVVLTATDDVALTGGCPSAPCELEEQITTDPLVDLDAGAWAPLGTTTSLDLDAIDADDGDGLHQVYFRVRDPAGHLSEASATIVLDRLAPSAPQVLLNPTDYATVAAVSAAFSAVGAAELCVYGQVLGRTAASCDSADSGWTELVDSLALTLADDGAGNLAIGTKTVQVRFRDEAGNTSAPVSDQVIFDDQVPSTSSATVTLAGVNYAGPGAQNVTRVQTVAVTLAGFADQVGGAGLAEMALSEDAGFAGASWVPYQTSTSWVLSGGDGEKTVRVKVRDAADNESAAVLDTIELDTTAPDNVALTIAGGAATTTDDTPSLSFSAEGEPFQYRLYNGVWVNCAAACVPATPLVIDLPAPLAFAADGVNQVRVSFRDRAGNVSTQGIDDVFLDRVAPGATLIGSVTPLSTTAFVDFDDADDPAPASGVAYYEVCSSRINTWEQTPRLFVASEGLITGLLPLTTYRFGVRAIDNAGNAGPWSNDCDSADAGEQRTDTLIGLRTYNVDGQVAFFGDRLQSSRGFVLSPRMRDAQTLRLVSCDARIEPCQQAGLVTADADLSGLCAAGTTADLAIAAHEGRPWMFVLCPDSAAGQYRLLSARAPNNPNNVADPSAWGYTTLGTFAQAPESTLAFGRSAAAAVNGTAAAVAYLPNAVSGDPTPTIRLHVCRLHNDCSLPASWTQVDLQPPAGLAPSGSLYLSLDAGESHLWLTWPSGGTAYTVASCDQVANDCTAAPEWRLQTVSAAGAVESFAPRVLEVGGTVYLAGSLRYAAGAPATDGLHVWQCAASSHCDAAGEWGPPTSLATNDAGMLTSLLGGSTAYPRLSFEWAGGYLYTAVNDYMTGQVRFARCAPSVGCGTIGDWVPIDVLETATVNGQPDLVLVHDNPLLFVGRDETRAYLMTPPTPAPLQRALVPDLEQGGVRASLSPSTAASVDGFRVEYNTTGWSPPFDQSIITMEPADDSIAVSSDGGTPYYGLVRAFNGADLSAGFPTFAAQGGSFRNTTVSSGDVRFWHYAASADCHLVSYLNGTELVVGSCPTGGCATLTSSEKRVSLGAVTVTDVQLQPVTGDFVSPNSFVYLFATVDGGATGGVKVTRASIDGSCALGALSAPVDVYAPTAAKPARLAVAASSSRLYLAHEADRSAATNDAVIRHCPYTTSNCAQTASWSGYTFDPGDYGGGALAIVDGRYLYWAAQVGNGPAGAAGTAVRRCLLTDGCDAAGDWPAGAYHQLTRSSAAAPTGQLVHQNGRLLWTQGGDLWWCKFGGGSTTDCVNARQWQRGDFAPELLSYVDAVAGVMGSVDGELIAVGLTGYAYWVGRCAGRCWLADSWYGGFIARGGNFAARWVIPGTMESHGRLGRIDDSGEIALVYPYVAPGDNVLAPEQLRLLIEASFDLDLP